MGQQDLRVTGPILLWSRPGRKFQAKKQVCLIFSSTDIFPNEKQGLRPFDFVNIRAKNKVPKTAKWSTLLPALEFVQLAGPLLYPDVLALPHSPVLSWLVKIMFRHFVKIVVIMYITVKTAFQTHHKRVFRDHVETGEKAEDWYQESVDRPVCSSSSLVVFSISSWSSVWNRWVSSQVLTYVINYKVNRCLARYSPRATTTNQSTKWASPKWTKMPILGKKS